MCLLHNITNIFVIYDIATENKELVTNHMEYYERNMSTEFNICLIVMCFLNTLALMFLVNLIKFHIELKQQGITTYEYLKLKENNTKESKIVVKVN